MKIHLATAEGATKTACGINVFVDRLNSVGSSDSDRGIEHATRREEVTCSKCLKSTEQK